MICSDISISVVVCTIVFIALFVFESGIMTVAEAKPYIESVSFDENGEVVVVDKTPNPNYPGDDKVKQAKFVYLSIPTGEASEITASYMSKELRNERLENLKLIPKYSIIWIVGINILGAFIFNKKELK